MATMRGTAGRLRRTNDGVRAAVRDPSAMPLRLRRRSPVRPRSLVAGATVLATGARRRPVRTPNVEAELVSERTALVPGPDDDRRAAAQDGATAGTRTGRTPATPGLPTTLAWKLPPGVTAGPIQWPAPKALPAGPLVNYGYEGEVLPADRRHGARATPPPGEPLTLGGPGRLAGLQGDVHSGGGGPRPRRCPSRERRPDPQWGKAIAADPRRAAAAAPGWRSAAPGRRRRRSRSR